MESIAAKVDKTELLQSNNKEKIKEKINFVCCILADIH